MKLSWLLLPTLLIATLLLAGCDDDDDDDTSDADDANPSVRVTPSLGVVLNAPVRVLAADGQTVLTNGNTGSSGTVTLTLGPTAGPVVLEVLGDADASYFDEAASTEIPFPDGERLRALAPVAEGEVAITLLTDLAYREAERRDVFPLSTEQVNQLNEAVRATLAPSVQSIVSVPTRFDESTTSGDLDDDEAGRYAAVLAALAELGAGRNAPALAVAQALREDATDGDIDGRSDGTALDTPYTDFLNEMNAALAHVAEDFGNAALRASVNRLGPVGIELDFGELDGGGNGTGGDWTLIITGTATTNGVTTPIPETTIGNTTAPTTGDEQAIEDAIRGNLAGQGGSADQVQFEVVSASDTEVIVEAQLTLSRQGFAVEQDLTYTWTRDGGDNGGNNASAAVPAAVQQQYTLVYAGNDTALLIDGEPYTVSLNSDNTLSIGGTTFTDPQNRDLFDQGSDRVVWQGGDLAYELSLSGAAFNELNVYDTANLTNGFPRFVGQLTEANGDSGNDEDTQAGSFRRWRMTEESNKVNGALTEQFNASSPAVWTRAFVEDRALQLMPAATADDFTIRELERSAEQKVFEVVVDNPTYPNAVVTYTLEVIAEDTGAHSATPPSMLTDLAGDYPVADTALPEVFGTIAAGHLSLELNIADNGDIRYTARDVDDGSVVASATTAWDGELDELDDGVLLIDKATTDEIQIRPVNDWFEFHIYLPLGTEGVGNNTVDIQWNVPYAANGA